MHRDLFARSTNFILGTHPDTFRAQFQVAIHAMFSESRCFENITLLTATARGPGRKTMVETNCFLVRFRRI